MEVTAEVASIRVKVAVEVMVVAKGRAVRVVAAITKGYFNRPRWAKHAFLRQRPCGAVRRNMVARVAVAATAVAVAIHARVAVTAVAAAVDPREGGGYGGGGVDPREGGGYGGGGYGGGGVDPRGGGGGYGGGGYGGFGRTASTSITRFQVTFMLERGAMVGGIDFTNRDPRPDQSGWQLLSLPIKEMRSTPGASGAVRRVIVTSDQEDTWYLAQASLVGETSDIKVSIRQDSDAPGAQIGEITVRPGPLTLVADVEAGATDTMIEWNFDADNVGNLPIGGAGAFDGMGGFPGGGGGYGGGGVDPRGGGGYGGGGVDPRGGGYGGGGVDPRGGGGYGGGGVDPRGGGRGGGGYGGGGVDPRGGGGGEEGGMGIDLGPRIDARGLQAKFEYPNEEQNYRVEVTVRDRSGKKAPATASILVKVRG